jgi:hypothetical protein
MKRTTLLQWIASFIESAAKDDNPARKIARIRALQSVKKTIATLPNNITKRHITSNPNLSDYMKSKLNLVIEDGSPPPQSNIQQLMEISGIGVALARQLDKQSVTPQTLNKHLSTLPLEVQLHIKYKPLKPIPRAYIDKFADMLKATLPKSTKYEIAGSYRRGNSASGDIDLLYIGDIQSLIDTLPGTKHTYAIGNEKASILYKLPRHKNFVKIDIMRATPLNWITYLLYLTGSKDNNVEMRAKAKSLGLLLNQNGLFMKNKKRISVKSEEDVYKKLGMVYRHPHNR